MRKLTSGLILALTVALAATFTGCEPNVPDNNNANNEEITIIPNNNNNRDRYDNDNDLEDIIEDPFDNHNEREDEHGDRLEDEHENGLHENNGTSAVEGDTPTADFGSPNIEDAIMTLTANNTSRSDFSNLPHTKIGWGLGKEVDGDNRPLDAVNANRDYGSLGATFIGENNPDSPTIYLTFDEGYENGCTAAILDTLKSRNARATFFVTYDYCKSAPDLVQRMIDEGHSVGNHSYSHPSFPDCSAEQIRAEIGKLHDYVKSNFEYEMRLIRFPMGEFSERSLAVAQSMGYTTVFWSFAYIDWNVNSQPDPSESLEKIKAGTHSGGIFLLHAVSKTNAEILGGVLDYWHGEGYSLGVIGESGENLAGDDGNRPAETQINL
jgi:peptidoglycan-N-acetylmuramic acid deacetylase